MVTTSCVSVAVLWNNDDELSCSDGFHTMLGKRLLQRNLLHLRRTEKINVFEREFTVCIIKNIP